MAKPRSCWKNQYSVIESASNFHNLFREIFANDPFFKNFNCYQEVLMSDLVTGYPNNYDAVDWLIDEFSLVLELHGKQHYVATKFSNSTSYFDIKKNFNNIKYRDNRKKLFLERNNYKYLEIPYTLQSKMNSEYLKELIFKEIYEH